VIRLAVRVARADAEAVLAELLELAPAGLEEREDGAVIEYVIYGAPGELPDLPAVRAAAGDALVEVSSSEVPDDWDERWKAFHVPVQVGEVRVRPPWEPAEPGTLDVVVDPGQAFGTGAHHTTRLCLELLLAHGPGEGGFADWGAGSGVLAVVAAKLGYSPVVAVDYDPLSVEASQENAAANRVRVQSDRVDLRSEPGPWAPTVCANLLRPLLLSVAGLMRDVPELLIVSGLLIEEGDEVSRAFAERGDAGDRPAGGWRVVGGRPRRVRPATGCHSPSSNG
jgi:ribosomal protein L11 methyltransferase